MNPFSEAEKNGLLFNYNNETPRTNKPIKPELNVMVVGKSPQMGHVFDLIRRVSKCDSNVLITGESGTGKEVVARAIHSLSNRANKPFIAINCAAIPDSLLESELFGHSKGSFTGALSDKRGLIEEANGGVLFLDEIGDMNIALQAKLLRVLQDRAVKPVGQNEPRNIDVRIISATHRNLQKAMETGSFREDLFYRLNVIPVGLPPLRERTEDIPLLAEYFLDKLSLNSRMPRKQFSISAIEMLKQYQWRGNVRQLANLVERAFIFCDGDVIDDQHITFSSQGGEFVKKSEAEISSQNGKQDSEILTFAEMEKNGMISALRRSGGNKEVSARLLGISRKTFYRKERDYGLTSR